MPAIRAARARLTRHRLRRMRRRDQWAKATYYSGGPAKPVVATYGRGSAPLPAHLHSPHPPYLTRRRQDVDRFPARPHRRYLTRIPKRYRRSPRP
ncbi:hypothetical protein ACIHJG_34220 [Streptomyces sp. NPDC052415]|uniref:hypothetical protein n=1 Tax=Streptomyces sp. NPDC052415 TaxID=3365690 RepID=UPI0037D2902B